MPCLTETIRETYPEHNLMLDDISNSNPLSTMIAIAWQLACILAVTLVEEAITKQAQAKTEWPLCPKCGRRLQSKGFVGREIKSMVGLIRWRRRLGRCPQQCAIGQVAPLDSQLGLQPNQKSDSGLQRVACLLAIFVPFSTAEMLLAQLLGIEVSRQTIWTWVQGTGKQMMAKLAKELAALEKGEIPEREALSATTLAETLLIGGDGVMVPFRPQAKTARGKTKWREVKVGILARLRQVQTRTGKTVTRLHHHRVTAVLGDIDDLSCRMWLEGLKQRVDQTQQVAWISDGGQGFWRLFRERFRPYATGILDFYHAAQNIWSGVKVWLDGRTTRAKTWFRDARHRLRHGESAAVLADIQAAVLAPDLPYSARATLIRLYHYLDKHRDHIQYEKMKQLGLPMGSGFVESTCKWLIQQRFKGVGMRWSEEGFNHLLHLRLAWVNGRFDTFFSPFHPSPKS